MKPISPGAKREAARRLARRPARRRLSFTLTCNAAPMLIALDRVQDAVTALRTDRLSSFTVNGHTYYEPHTLPPVRPGYRIERIWTEWPAMGEGRKEWGRLVRDPAPIREDR